MPKNTHNLGRAGELAVASQLLFRDIPVLTPFVDIGVDLVAGNNVRIQVKSSRTRNRKGGGYIFTLSGRILPSRGTKYRWKKRDWATECDFIVFWGADENRFWVVPSRIFAGKFPQSLTIASDAGKNRVNHEQIKQMYANGMKQADVARAVGVSPMCVYECITGRTKGTYPWSFDVRSYENAWHEIEQAVNLVNQIDDIDSLLSPSEIEHAEQNFKEFADTSEKR